MHRAAFDGRTAAIAYLLGHKKSPEDYVSLVCHINLIRFGFIFKFHFFFKADKNGWSALHGAASAGHIDTCNVLLDAGASPDAVVLIIKVFFYFNFFEISQYFFNVLCEKGEWWHNAVALCCSYQMACTSIASIVDTVIVVACHRDISKKIMVCNYSEWRRHLK